MASVQKEWVVVVVVCHIQMHAFSREVTDTERLGCAASLRVVCQIQGCSTPKNGGGGE